MKMFSTFIVASILSYATAASADVVLTLKGSDPSPTVGTQYLIGLQVNDAVSASLNSSLFVSNATQGDATGAELVQGSFEDFPNVHFADEAALGEALGDDYQAVNDSYVPAPWEAQAGSFTGPMNLSSMSHGSFGDPVAGGQNLDFIYITRPDTGGPVSITGEVVRGDGSGGVDRFSFNYSLSSNGQLTAVPEPSAFLFLGLIGVVQGVRVWRQKRSAAPAVAA